MNKIEAFGKKRYSKYMFGDVYDKDFLKWVDYIRSNIFKVEYSKVLNDVENIIINYSNNKKFINYYYFDQLRFETYFNHSKFNIDECLSSLEIMLFIYNWSNNFIKIFTKKDLIIDFYSFFRISGIPTACLPSDYKLKDIDYILKKYNVNDVYYDPSSGWGSRMLVAARNGIKYISSDPSVRLSRKLNMLGEDIRRYKDFDFKLYTQGSEIFIPEIENEIGLIFTSPPYDDLEQYDNGDNNISDYNLFVKKSVENYNKYIINGGYIIINIDDKNYKTWYDNLNLYFDFIENEILSVSNLRNYRDRYDIKKENIMVFKNK